MSFWVLGVDHRSCPLEQRAALSLSQSPQARAELLKLVPPAVWLSTCNRVEIYLDQEPPEAFLETWTSLAGLKSARDYFYQHSHERAVRHLFRVCSSLESMVLGETQITGQIRKAYEEAIQRVKLSPNLHRIFQEGFRVTKRIRSETEVGQFAVSVPSIGVKLAEKVFGDLGRRRIGILGLGEIGRVAAEHFGCLNPRELLLFNRTEERTRSLESQFETEGVHARASSIDEILESASVIVNSIPEKLLSVKQLEALGQRENRVLILDLAVPPVIPKSLLESAFLYFVDDLEKIANENQELRLQELELADEIVEEEVTKVWSLLESSSLTQTFKRLDKKLVHIRDQELEALKKRLSHLDSGDWREIEQMAQRLSSKILQDPIVELKTRAQDSKEKDTWLQYFRNIFKV